MLIRHKGFVEYELPDGWESEVNGENVIIYDPDGEGSMVMSFYRSTGDMPIEKRIYKMAQSFVEQIMIKQLSDFSESNDNRRVFRVCCEGIDANNWYIKLYIIAKSPRIVVATYNNKIKNHEIETYNEIVKSMKPLA